jgi:hypothetical protein
MRMLFVSTALLTALGLGPAPAARAGDPVLPLSAQDQAEITRLLGAGVVGKALPSQPITDTSVYFPLEERSSAYQVTSGKDAGKQQTLRTMKGKRPGGNDAWRFELSPSLAGFINQIEGGDLMMPAVSDADEGVIVVTKPANPFVLKGMKPGETRSFSQTVSVNYLDDPSDQRYSGTLTGTYTYVGTYEVTVPAGTYPSVLLRLNYAGKVGPAHTEDVAYYFFAPHVGVVAMISQEDVEAFWVIHIDSSTGKVLVSPQAS